MYVINKNVKSEGIFIVMRRSLAMLNRISNLLNARPMPNTKLKFNANNNKNRRRRCETKNTRQTPELGQNRASPYQNLNLEKSGGSFQ